MTADGGMTPVEARDRIEAIDEEVRRLEDGIDALLISAALNFLIDVGLHEVRPVHRDRLFVLRDEWVGRAMGGLK